MTCQVTNNRRPDNKRCPTNLILYVQKHENLPIPPRQERMYPRLFLRIFKFGRNASWSRTPFNLSCHVEAFFEVVCHGCQCRVPKTFLPLLLPCTVHEPRWCFTKGCKIFVFVEKTYGNFLCLMKSLISNWRKTHGHCDQTSGFNWDASVFASEDVSFSPDSDSNATLHKSFYHYLCYIILACPGMPCS